MRLRTKVWVPGSRPKTKNFSYQTHQTRNGCSPLADKEGWSFNYAGVWCFFDIGATHPIDSRHYQTWAANYCPLTDLPDRGINVSQIVMHIIQHDRRVTMI